MSMLLSPVVRLEPALLPIAMLLLPEVIKTPAVAPKRELLFPVFEIPAVNPKNEFEAPAVLLKPAEAPMKVLSLALIFLNLRHYR